jgi:putative ABC transport system substrate-binding protein
LKVDVVHRLSLARPGTNVTGLASLSAELIAKRVELIKELFPRVSVIAVLVYPNNPGIRPTLKALEVVGSTLGIEIRRIEIRTASDFDKAFRSAAMAGARAVLLQDDPLNRLERVLIAETALKHRLPTIAGLTENAEAGVLVAYAPDRQAMLRRSATFVDKILKGAKADSIPFEQAQKFELVVNMRTAKALGLMLPQLLLLRADRIIH